MTVDASFLAARTSTVQLSDGFEVVLRPVVPEDKALLEEAFERLSPESRYRRFFSPMPRLSESLLTYLTVLDYYDHFAWQPWWARAAGPAPAGVSRYVRLPERPGLAEMAVAVIDPYQHRGIGTLLLDVLVLQAIEASISQFEGSVLADNRPMQYLLLSRRCPFPPRRCWDPAVRAGSPGTRRGSRGLPAPPDAASRRPRRGGPVPTGTMSQIHQPLPG